VHPPVDIPIEEVRADLLSIKGSLAEEIIKERRR
jgi:hypothetical protein